MKTKPRMNLSFHEIYPIFFILKESFYKAISSILSYQDHFNLEKLAKEGSLQSQLQLGVYYLEGSRVFTSRSLSNILKKAFYYLKLAADQGDSDAQAAVGYLYENYDQSDQFLNKAFYYYQLSADQGNSLALARLGKLFFLGQGIEKSKTKAFHYYDLSLETQSDIAWIYLAEAYEKGIEVEKSKEKANFYRQKRFQFLKEKADEGIKERQYEIGICYETGDGVKQSNESAFKYYQLSAHQGYKFGLLKLANCYAKGKGTQKSLEQTIHYYKVLADQGDSRASCALAWYLLENKIDMNPEYYCNSILTKGRGHPTDIALCNYYLGVIYENHEENKKFFHKEAAYNYNCSSELGCGLATQRLRDAYLHGDLGFEKSSEKASEYNRILENQDNIPFLEPGIVLEGEEKEKQSFKAVDKTKSISLADSSHHEQFAYFKKQADRGSAIDQAKVGQFYSEGIGTKKSPEMAFHYYQLSANQNCSDGLLGLAICFENGKGVPENIGKAIYHYKLAVDQGSLLAQYLLADCLLHKQSNHQGIELLIKTINDDRCSKKLLSYCEHLLARCFEEGITITKSNEKALHYYKISAEHGCEEAQDRLGNAYLNGELGLEKSIKKSVEYYKLAANQGLANALVMLGTLYENGCQVEKSLKKAFYYYNLAAEKDIKKGFCSSSGIFSLARCYELGIGIEKSLEKAAYYYRLSAELGFDSNYEQAGKCYHELNDKIRAASCFNLADQVSSKAINQKKYFESLSNKAKQGDIKAILRLARECEDGFWLRKDPEEAIRYYNQAAEVNNSVAQFKLAQFYEKGIGVEKSKEKALFYYQLAADQGNIHALYQLGTLYQYGDYVPQSYLEALHYYQLAADKGHEPSKCKIDYIRRLIY